MWQSLVGGHWQFKNMILPSDIVLEGQIIMQMHYRRVNIVNINIGEVEPVCITEIIHIAIYLKKN